MRIIDLYQVDAFTDTLFGGNPAGVVTNAAELDDKEMAAIAREMNLSETAFVLSPTVAAADLRLRYFTPTTEVKFCGHATIAALYQLALLNMYGLGESERKTVRVETGVGLLEMLVFPGVDSRPRVTFVAPTVAMEPYRLQGNDFAHACGLPHDIIRRDTEVLVDSQLNYLYLAVDSLARLGELEFDFARIRARFHDEINVFCLFTNETVSEKSHLHARGLAPAVGIDEDPFTGSMQAGLIHAAKSNGLLDKNQQRIVVEQGNFIGRPGRAEIDHDVVTDDMRITAAAVSVFSTQLTLESDKA